MKDFQIVILAAGNGKRMQSGDTPKVLVEVSGKPMINHLLESVHESGIDRQPAVVVSYQADKVMETLGDKYIYIHQPERLGTGHAVRCGKSQLEGLSKHVLVLYGDHPFVSPDMIRRLAQTHQETEATLTMATVAVPDYLGWRSSFSDFGRIKRDERGNIEKIIEKKDATPEELELKEVNPSYFCFQASWLWPSLYRLTNHNVQGEYYLTDLVKLAQSERKRIATVAIEPIDALGVNTPEQRALLEELVATQAERLGAVAPAAPEFNPA